MNQIRKFTRAIVRTPGVRIVSGLTMAPLGVPDYERARQQHALYCQALEQCGLALTRLDADERYPDSTFVEDTAVIVEALQDGATPGLPDCGPQSRTSAPVAILTRPGAPSRAGEIEGIREVLSQFCPQAHSLEEPGTVDGGDICGAGNHFFIGLSQRTNEAGAKQLAALLTSYGYSSSYVDIRGVPELLHLKSGVAYLGDNRLVVIDALAKRKEFQGYDLVPVNVGEEYAANCVRVNDFVLIATEYPLLAGTLCDLGYKTIALEMTEFQKLDGGLSCLSLRF